MRDVAGQLRRLALVVAAVVALTGPGLWAARPAAAASGVDVGAILGQVDSFWRYTFAANGLTYTSPNVAPVYGEMTTGCGPIDPYSFGPAGYCPIDQTIYFSLAYLGEDTNPAIWYVAVSHEWGHHIEKLLGYPDEPSVASEQRTDCMAGAFIGAAVDVGLTSRSTFNWAFHFMLLIGDPPFIGRENFTHDIAAHRAQQFNAGYLGGVAACGIGLS